MSKTSANIVKMVYLGNSKNYLNLFNNDYNVKENSLLCDDGINPTIVKVLEVKDDIIKYYYITINGVDIVDNPRSVYFKSEYQLKLIFPIQMNEKAFEIKDDFLKFNFIGI